MAGKGDQATQAMAGRGPQGCSDVTELITLSSLIPLWYAAAAATTESVLRHCTRRTKRMVCSIPVNYRSPALNAMHPRRSGAEADQLLKS